MNQDNKKQESRVNINKLLLSSDDLNIGSPILNHTMHNRIQSSSTARKASILQAFQSARPQADP